MEPASPPAPPPRPVSIGIVNDGRSTPRFAQSGMEATTAAGSQAAVEAAAVATLEPDPGSGWLPNLLRKRVESMSMQEIADLLGDTETLQAFTLGPETAHSSVLNSSARLQDALSDNINFATHVLGLEAQVKQKRDQVQAQLLSTHALERQWRQKQADVDAALSSFSPASLYNELTQALHEQEGVCQAIEEGFLDGRSSGSGDDEGQPASERETAEWLRQYRDAKVVAYLRRERKERWDEGRVGGWPQAL